MSYMPLTELTPMGTLLLMSTKPEVVAILNKEVGDQFTYEESKLLVDFVAAFSNVFGCIFGLPEVHQDRLTSTVNIMGTLRTVWNEDRTELFLAGHRKVISIGHPNRVTSDARPAGEQALKEG